MWKSPASDFLISFCNSQLKIPVHRFADYSDFYALIVLLLAFFVKPINQSETLTRKFAIGSICITSFIAFTATSLPRRLADDNKVLLDKYIKTRKKEDQIIKVLEDQGLGPVKKEAVYEKIWSIDDYYLKPKISDTLIIPADSLYKGVYRRIDHSAGYSIPKIYVRNDSIYNLQFIVSEYDHGKTEIRLYSFEYHKIGADSNLYLPSYYAWRKFKKPLKKKFKGILKE